MISLFVLFAYSYDGDFQVVWQLPLEAQGIYARGPVAVGRKSICVVDSKQRQLLFIDKDSQTTHRVGHRGEGPGEFQSIGNVDWSEGQAAFFVWDNMRNTMTRFTEEGAFEKTFRLSTRPDGFNMAQEGKIYYVSENTGLAGSKPTIIYSGIDDLDAGEKIWQMDALLQPVGLHHSDPELTVSLRFDWDPGLIIGGNNQLTAFMYSGKPVIHVIDHTDGNRMSQFSIAIRLIPFVDEDMDRRFSGPSAAFRKKIEPYIDRPDHWPYAAQLIVDKKVDIWVISPSPPRKLGSHYVHYNKDGELIGTGDLRFKPVDIADGSIYWIASEADDNLMLEQVSIN